MRLRTRFALLLGLSAALAAAVTVFAAQEIRQMAALAQAAARGQEALSDARALLNHTYEFALHGLPRAAQQWRGRHAALVANLSNDGELTGMRVERDLQDELENMPALFERLEQARAAAPADPAAARRAELLTDNLIAGTQLILDSSHDRVVRLAEQRTVSERRVAAVAVAALLLLVGVIAMTGRGAVVDVLRPLRRLHRVMTDVANGDLTGRTAFARKDEIGELSGAFDAMTDALQAALLQRQASEQQLRLIAENLPVRVARFDARARFLFANRATWRQYGVQSEADLLGRTLADACGAAGYAVLRPRIEAVLAGRQQDFVIEEAKDSASPRWSAVSLVPDRSEDGAVCGWYAMIQDITETTLNRRRIEQSLAEKDMLLREVHHRVKNNLQIVTSLLSLQAGQSTDPTLRAMFDESRDRIRSMALIHEKLYRTESLAAIDFGEYLRSLVSMIEATQRRDGIATDVQAEQVVLDIDRAVPAALLVNELVTNSFKHGFPVGRAGRVDVFFGRASGDRLRLRVRDDGVGAPQVDPARAASLGLRLVRLLAAQLDASLATQVTPGYETVLEFAATPFDRTEPGDA